MKNIFYMIILIILLIMCQNPKNSKIHNDPLVNCKKNEIAPLIDSSTNYKLFGKWGCKEGILLGATNIYSLDSIELGISNNQVWILAKAIQTPNTNEYNLYLLDPIDLGKGGMTLNWNNFSKTIAIGKLTIINDSCIVKIWYGFYDDKQKKYIDGGAYDWDNCDTIYLK